MEYLPHHPPPPTSTLTEANFTAETQPGWRRRWARRTGDERCLSAEAAADRLPDIPPSCQRRSVGPRRASPHPALSPHTRPIQSPKELRCKKEASRGSGTSQAISAGAREREREKERGGKRGGEQRDSDNGLISTLSLKKSHIPRRDLETYPIQQIRAEGSSSGGIHANTPPREREDSRGRGTIPHATINSLQSAG